MRRIMFFQEKKNKQKKNTSCPLEKHLFFYKISKNFPIRIKKMKKLHSCNYDRRKSRYYYCTSFALVTCSFTKKNYCFK